VLVGTEGLYLLVCRRDKVLPFALGTLVVALCFMPWVIAVAWAALNRGSAVSQIQWIAKPTAGDLVRFYAKLTGGFPVAGTTAIGMMLFLVPVVVWALRGLRFAPANPEAMRARNASILLTLVALVPPVLTFAASHALPQSVWAERQLTFVAAPFLMLVAAAVVRLPRFVPAACVAWAVAAGFVTVTAAPPKIAWDRLAAEMATAETGDGPVTIYAADAHVAWCLQFYLNEANETRFRILTAAEPAGEQFWVAWREPQMTGETPVGRLVAHGYRVGDVRRSGTQWQTAAIASVRRASGGEEADNQVRPQP
jgi:hypothetical protein